MLLVDGEGQFKRLSPSFSAMSDITNLTDDTIVYTFTVVDFGAIRFIPANQAFQPADFVEDAPGHGYTSEFLAGLGEYLKIMAQQIPSHASLSMAKSLLTAYQVMERKAAADKLQVQELLRAKEIRDFYISLLGDALIEGAQKVANTTNAARAQQ
jgi:hypothetical protein